MLSFTLILSLLSGTMSPAYGSPSSEKNVPVESAAPIGKAAHFGRTASTSCDTVEEIELCPKAIKNMDSTTSRNFPITFYHSIPVNYRPKSDGDESIRGLQLYNVDPEASFDHAYDDSCSRYEEGNEMNHENFREFLDNCKGKPSRDKCNCRPTTSRLLSRYRANETDCVDKVPSVLQEELYSVDWSPCVPDSNMTALPFELNVKVSELNGRKRWAMFQYNPNFEGVTEVDAEEGVRLAQFFLLVKGSELLHFVVSGSQGNVHYTGGLVVWSEPRFLERNQLHFAAYMTLVVLLFGNLLWIFMRLQHERRSRIKHQRSIFGAFEAELVHEYIDPEKFKKSRVEIMSLT